MSHLASNLMFTAHTTSSSSSRRRSPPPPAPAPARAPVPPPPTSAGFLQTMAEGVALGVGSSLGHRAVGAVLGSASEVASGPASGPASAPTRTLPTPCTDALDQFHHCMTRLDPDNDCTALYRAYHEFLQGIRG